jgi:hypothetical protein
VPWWSFRRKEEPSPDTAGTAGKDGSSARVEESHARGAPIIRDAERRRLSRLLRRRANLEFDIADAEKAFLPENRWTERAGQLDEAIRQAEGDLSRLEPEPREPITDPLPPTPIEIAAISTDEPASVTLRVGDHQLVYREEVDWAERGHQIALPQLTRAEGDVDPFVPDDLPEPTRSEFIEHLRHSFSIVADEALERTIDQEPIEPRTLTDLARPCLRCGGWIDPKGRCPACAQLDWQRQELREAADRLIKERNDVLDDLALTRDRLPILRRQLAEAEHDIAQLEAKGVTPAP